MSAPPPEFPWFLPRDSDMARRVHGFDWGNTSLGPLDGWRPALCHALAALMRSPAPMGLFHGREGILLYNDAYKAIAGLRHPQVFGQPVLAAWPEVADFNRHVLDTVFAGGALSFHDVHVVLNRSDAPQDAWLHIDFSPLVDDTATVAGVMFVITDTTARKEAEATLASEAATLQDRVNQRTAELLRTQDALRQSQKMEAIGNLTGGVAHDFNNLLQVISGNLQLLAEDVHGSERGERRVRNAMAGVARGSKLATQLLAFGRRQPLAPKVVNVGRFVRNMDDLLRRTLGEGIEVETVVAGGLWNTLIDPGNVENALLNLALNARDAMDGQGRLTIEAGNAYLDASYVDTLDDVAAGQYVLLAVTDTGHGIDAQTMDKVFEPFFTTKPEGRGTGLGLSMVYGFVKQSGGHIKLYSEPGHGTTVKLYLPRTTQSEDIIVDVDTGPLTGGSETILVAEDDEAVRDTVVAMLADLGYRVLKARDAPSALSIIDSGIPIDLLFTDVVMPGALKSPELARKARERLPGISVLFTSGYTENSIVHGGRLDEGVELLSKPYSRETLARKLRQMLSGHARRQDGGPATVAPPPANSPPAIRVVRVLVVEDDWLVRTTVAEMLQLRGHEVFEAADAARALEVLAEQPVDVLVSDVSLPGMSGVELVAEARARHPGLAAVYATGHAHADGVQPDARTLVLVKPYGSEALNQALARLFPPPGVGRPATAPGP
ncbi:response regulator [Luteibacter aegosomaticola]|uniref:hybrid sensor histidine kinase/response regulator n=1 Tax=Luteibacter aegosomaticola TaxID=2911538 RepID=UPI001FF83323|nr:response regulator [Luteibacter aegosomaticola]UPG90317.1 response regulator [Luteibacter aegosomaticola]